MTSSCRNETDWRLRHVLPPGDIYSVLLKLINSGSSPEFWVAMAQWDVLVAQHSVSALKEYYEVDRLLDLRNVARMERAKREDAMMFASWNLDTEVEIIDAVAPHIHPVMFWREMGHHFERRIVALIDAWALKEPPDDDDDRREEEPTPAVAPRIIA